MKGIRYSLFEADGSKADLDKMLSLGGGGGGRDSLT